MPQYQWPGFEPRLTRVLMLERLLLHSEGHGHRGAGWRRAVGAHAVVWSAVSCTWSILQGKGGCATLAWLNEAANMAGKSYRLVNMLSQAVLDKVKSLS